MKASAFNGIVKGTIKTIKNLEQSKGNDYAGKEDRLANFKELEHIGLAPENTCMVHLQKHYGTIQRYVDKLTSGQDSQMSQPVEERIDDAILYLILLKGLIQERQELASSRDSRKRK
jgi:hypothetical protein